MDRTRSRHPAELDLSKAVLDLSRAVPPTKPTQRWFSLRTGRPSSNKCWLTRRSHRPLLHPETATFYRDSASLWVGGNLPLGYKIMDGKIAIVEEEAELVRSIFRRYLELGSVNELLRDLKERNIRTKARLLSTGATRGGIPFGRGALYYVLSNRFYIGEVKYKDDPSR
jgi:hypothetical protein